MIRQGRKEEAERSAFGTAGVKWTGQQRKDKPEHRRLFLWHAAAEKIRKREKGIRRWTMGWTSRKVSASLCYSLQGGEGRRLVSTLIASRAHDRSGQKGRLTCRLWRDASCSKQGSRRGGEKSVSWAELRFAC